MKFLWTFMKTQPQIIKSFLKEQGISKGLLAKIKFQGGHILINQQEQNVLYTLHKGDQVEIMIPKEEPHETMLEDECPLDIVFEDEHLLVVNKPFGVASIPAQYHPNGTMANRVKHYYVCQQYENQVIHVVTRLDRDTTGLMLFAKHGFAHARLDQQLREKKLLKRYEAFVSGNISSLQAHGLIDAPIGRDTSSLLKRKVTCEGKEAKTEYWRKEPSSSSFAFVAVQLHTGRTHQIRVHFASLGCPLVGDELYGGTMLEGINRQALHCSELNFIHPFTQEECHFILEIPQDMQQVIEKNRL